MKTTSPFSTLLRQSPFKPVQEHMRVVSRCVAKIPDLFDAMIKKDQERINDLAIKIGELESEADSIKDEFRLHMPKRVLFAVARSNRISWLILLKKLVKL